MKLNFIKSPVIIAVALLSIISCSKDDDGEVSPDIVVDTPSTEIPPVYSKIYGASSITSDGTFITIKTTGTPDHKSVYYETTSDLYEAYSGTNTYNGTDYTFVKNPNTIVTFDYTFKLPLNPTKATNTTATSLGAMGVALNGVPFFNQYAGPNEQALTDEYKSFDQQNGHPTGNGTYHYHVEPIYLTTVIVSQAELLGFLLDGFPVYGPIEDGVAVTETALDEFHGHEHTTEDYPNGIYHYHITDTDPYINGSGFYGNPGTVTQ